MTLYEKKKSITDFNISTHLKQQSVLKVE